MSVYVTGDTHGQFNRLSYKQWSESKNLTRGDYLVVTGDFGLIFHNVESPDEKYWKKWLTSKPWTTLFVCGNHENHPKLNLLPLESKFGGWVGVVAPNIYHLRRGEIYALNDKKVLAFGGALSYDKNQRTEGINWWREEIPSYEDIENALTNLEKHNHTVDYIIGHTCPTRCLSYVSEAIGRGIHVVDPTYEMLEHILTITKFDKFFCGHWHVDREFEDSKYNFLYETIRKIG
jgi:predicted phosphodiesterase